MVSTNSNVQHNFCVFKKKIPNLFVRFTFFWNSHKFSIFFKKEVRIFNYAVFVWFLNCFLQDFVKKNLKARFSQNKIINITFLTDAKIFYMILVMTKRPNDYFFGKNSLKTRIKFWKNFERIWYSPVEFFDTQN